MITKLKVVTAEGLAKRYAQGKTPERDAKSENISSLCAVT